MWQAQLISHSLSYLVAGSPNEFVRLISINSINLQVQVIGDSHARRIRDQSGVYFKCRDVDISFRCKGGARTPFLKIPFDQSSFDLIIFVIGSNDLADGKDILVLYNELIGYAQNYIDGSFCSRVVIMTLLPRADPWYQERMKQFNAMLTSNTKDSIVGWYWSKKLKGYLSLTDGVHLIERGYQKAVLYLGSPIFYFYKPSYKKKRLI